MFNPWAYQRTKARDSVLAGIGEALQAAAGDGEEPPADLAELRARLAAAVAPKALPEPGAKKNPRKAD